MRIAINTLALLRNKAGAEQYTLNIINELAKIDKHNEYFIIVSDVNYDIYSVEQSNFNIIHIKVNTYSKLKRILYEQIVVPFKLKQYKIDVLFNPCNIMPLFCPCETVAMIFDMHWFLESKKLSRLRVLYVKNFIKFTAKKADKVLTLSESSKKDIIRFTKISEHKIIITPVGKTPLCALKTKLKKQEWPGIKKNYNIERKYIMFLGQLLFRKNVDAVIKALGLIKKEKIKLDFDFIVVGGKAEAYQSLLDLVKQNNLENEVKFLGQLEDRDTAYILSNADMFVYPSLYEGFGIPILEAMYYGVPVITSDISSLPEVGGKACVYISPYNIEEIKKSILNMLYNETLKSNNIEQGFLQAEKFSWENSANQTLSVFLSVQ
jgi:glycosyltransferase involved in cell wall biosynthesis